VAPASPTVAVGHSRELSATASYSDHSTADRTSASTWASRAPEFATVAAGLVTGVAAGTTEVVATFGGMADSVTVTVTASSPPLAGLTVTPKPAAVGVGATVTLSATANYTDGSFTAITAQATWSSTNSGVATVSQGVVTGVSAGSAGVVATYSGFADTCLVTVTGAGPTGYVYPLKMGPTSRYLVDQTGKPFLMIGDAGWSLIAQLSDQDADTYLAGRQQLGFTLVEANLIEHLFATNAPADIYNIPPFSGANFVTPNEAYFAHVDYILRSAAQKGIVVLLAPAYLGYGCGEEGWCAEIEAASTADMTAWGRYLGSRYKDYDNLIWLIGGDTDPVDQGVASKLEALVAGIQQYDTRHLFTAHNHSEEMAVTPWTGASWLTINNVYSYSTMLYQPALTAYHLTPPMPFFLIESKYEGQPKWNVSAQELRAQGYWTVLSGGYGQVYGNCPIEFFDAPAGIDYCALTSWQMQLTSPGARNMQYLGKLFTSRHWHLLVPDEGHTALTSGFGSGTDYATAAVASDGSSIISYLPSARTVTIYGGGLGPSMTAWWYDPSAGVSTSAGTYSTSTAHDFTPPGSGDWVLVVDNTALNLPAP
jgi:hypothetical protein